jgi:5-deoxy-glucuronate isomerase
MTDSSATPATGATTVRRTSLVRAGVQARHISLELIEAAPGATIELTAGQERLAVVMSGRAEVGIDGSAARPAGGRADVFEGPGDAVYLPPEATATLITGDGWLTLALAAADAGSGPPGPARVIRPADQRVAQVGRQSWERTVRTILGPDQPASRLLVGETINPPGLWSSFPPHRHDRESEEETALEEVYLYRVQPQNGFGVQVRYDSDVEQEARVVRDGDVAVIRSGYHPVAAAPGHRLYYLWVMAGDGRVMRPYIDPRYRWVEEEAR